MKPISDIFNRTYVIGGKPIGSLLPKKLRKKDFKILNAPSLFVDWSNLNQGLCPFCGHTLYVMKEGKYFRCKSKTHRKSFVISSEKLFAAKARGQHEKDFHSAIERAD